MSFRLLSSSLLLVTLLTACSGGGGGSDETAPGNNQQPIANAGPDIPCVIGNTVQLNASQSMDPDGDLLTFHWSLVASPLGSAARLDDATRAMPTFAPDLPGLYVARVLVSDTTNNNSSDDVTLNCGLGNLPPIADAGDYQYRVTGSTITLDGTRSYDANGDTLTYFWRLDSSPAGSTASLTNANSATPSFVADRDGNYELTLIVDDGKLKAIDTVQVGTWYQGTLPLADAGNDQTVLTGSTIVLNGSNSHDLDGDPLQWQWVFVAIPAGSTATLSNSNTSQPTFLADRDGDYVVRLVLDHRAGGSDTVVITASSGNVAPIAHAGTDQQASTGAQVTLDGTQSSDANGDTLTYHWQALSIPAGSSAVLSDATAASPTFTADVAGTYVFSVAVSDGSLQRTDSVQITVTDPVLTLYRKSGLINPTFVEVALPYLASTTMNATIIGQPSVALDVFRLDAHGQDYTIINTSATDDSPNVGLSYSGIVPGMVVRDGESLVFELFSNLTGGEIVHIEFSFEIAETGETFVARYTLTTN